MRGDPAKRLGEVFEIVTAIVGTKGADKLAKGSKVGAAASKVDDVATVANKLDDGAKVGNKVDDVTTVTTKVDDAAASGTVAHTSAAGPKVLPPGQPTPKALGPGQKTPKPMGGNSRFVVEPNGTTVDTTTTPRGSFDQPGGGRTDLLQQGDHGAGHSHTHRRSVHRNPQTGEEFPGRLDGGNPVSLEELNRILQGYAPRSRPKG